jgi:hypothetical protein
MDESSRSSRFSARHSIGRSTARHLRSWTTLASANKIFHSLMTRRRILLTILRSAVSGEILRGLLKVKSQSDFIPTKAKMLGIRTSEIKTAETDKMQKKISRKILKHELVRWNLKTSQIMLRKKSHRCMVDKSREEIRIVMCKKQRPR